MYTYVILTILTDIFALDMSTCRICTKCVRLPPSFYEYAGRYKRLTSVKFFSSFLSHLHLTFLFLSFSFFFISFPFLSPTAFLLMVMEDLDEA